MTAEKLSLQTHNGYADQLPDSVVAARLVCAFHTENFLVSHAWMIDVSVSGQVSSSVCESEVNEVPVPEKF